ncbi:MAG TPA: hypothetical protein VE397_00595 [Stellaceae bacterium]|jgi:hypothetical protein|nr:hypothetical protein [Stellaceae bacterium]
MDSFSPGLAIGLIVIGLLVLGGFITVGLFESRRLERDRKVKEALKEPTENLKREIDSL